MGFLKTRWKAEYQGHELGVLRNELSKRISLEWDGVEVAHRSSVIGLGSLQATVDVGSGYRDSGQVEVRVTVEWGGSARLAHGSCTITVDGSELPVERVA
jgi:hypothetical protein